MDCPYLNPKQSGDIVYKIFVGTGDLPADTTILFFAEFENLVEVDSNQALLYDICSGIRSLRADFFEFSQPDL